MYFDTCKHKKIDFENVAGFFSPDCILYTHWQRSEGYHKFNGRLDILIHNTVVTSESK